MLSTSYEQVGPDKVAEMVNLNMEDDETPTPVVPKDQVPEKITPQRLGKFAQEPQQLDEEMLNSQLKKEKQTKPRSPYTGRKIPASST